ncbi:MAG: hypothetical protein HDS29_03195 [Bacteroides sp.]|nr:hypothetical protein [Bacteroides sp.]
MNRYLHIALVSLLMSSCGSHDIDVAQSDDEAVAMVGSQVLTGSELRSRTPGGLSYEDSVRFVRAYVRQWIDARIVGEVAARNISDMSHIDEMVENYRNELIMWEYSRLMYASQSSGDIDRDSLRSYYDQHKNDYRSTSSMVKGIFVKIPSGDRRLPNIRKWVMSKNSDNLDRLEKESMDGNMEYEYFRDDWVQLPILERKFPGDISRRLSGRGERRIEMSDGGVTYILAVSDLMPVGSVMPFDLVEEMIVEQYRSARRPEYERSLRRQLFDKGVNDGIVKVNIDLGMTTDAGQKDDNNK